MVVVVLCADGREIHHDDVRERQLLVRRVVHMLVAEELPAVIDVLVLVVLKIRLMLTGELHLQESRVACGRNPRRAVLHEIQRRLKTVLQRRAALYRLDTARDTLSCGHEAVLHAHLLPPCLVAVESSLR